MRGTSQPVAPLPNPPHKGEGAASSVWDDRAKSKGLHLPLDGGGWEGVRPMLRRQAVLATSVGAH